MNQFQPANALKGLFKKGQQAPPEKSDELAPLQYLRELYDTRLNIGPEREVMDPKALRRRFAIARAIAKLFKPLLRFDNLLSFEQRLGIELVTSQTMTPDVFAAAAPGQTALKNYVKTVLDCADNHTKPLVWLEWCLSTDLIYAFDAQPFCTEALVAVLYPLGLEPNEKLIDFGEQAGVPPEYCSASKNALGSYLARQLPDPECIVTVSHPCDSMISSYQSLEYLCQKPMFRLDTPYWDDDRAIDYYAADFKKLIAFLEKHLDRKLDYDRLKAALTEVNKTNEMLMEMNEMFRAIPSPGSVMALLLCWFFRVVGLGTPEVTEATRGIHKLTKANYEAGKSMIKEEKIRVIWFDVPIAFYPLVIWMEEKFGAVVAMDAVTYVDQPPIDTSTEESMIRGLAVENMNLAMARQFHGPIEFFDRELHKVCEEYSGDCFIFAGHAGCKHGWASTRILKEYMKKIDMPLLILTSDIFDRRLTNEDQLKAQIEEFFVSNGLV